MIDGSSGNGWIVCLGGALMLLLLVLALIDYLTLMD